ncbi:MAG: response regulator [Desulfomonile tiedjei]|nr:response regulator [Desulfomonile tiedjei]
MEDRRIKVLIVDDEPYIGDLLRRYLTPEGYDCRVVFSGEEALKALESNSFNLVLADVMMPGMSGIDLLQITKSLYPEVAVLMVTAIDDKDTGVLAVELGAYGYVIKPFERNEILINVANAMERRRLTRLVLEGAPDKPLAARATTQRHPPVKISARKVLDLINSGMDEAALMGELNLSAKALNSLMDQLVATGLFKQSDVDRRSSLSPGSVVVDLEQTKFPESNREKPAVSAKDAAECIRSGMDDSSLMKRYGVSAKGLRSLFRKLVASGVVEQFELDKRMSETHQWAFLEE